MMIRSLWASFALLVLAVSSPWDSVDTRISSGGFGFGVGGVNPGPQVPFGACRLGPDTDDKLVWNHFNHYGGYYYPDSYVRIFSHTHMVGPGAQDWGNVGVMASREPVTSDLIKSQAYNYRSSFNHSTETAKPGDYRVLLETPNVNVELTAGGTHVGVHRYTFESLPKATANHGILLIDVCHTLSDFKDHPCANASVAVNDNSISGWLDNAGGLTGRAQHKSGLRGVRIWFYMQWNISAASSVAIKHGVWENEAVAEGNSSAGPTTSQSLGAWLDFTSSDAGPLVVVLQVGISFVSADNAKLNLQQVNPSLSFGQIRANAVAQWQAALDQIEIEGGTPDQAVNFYSAMYRTFLAPTTYSEINGLYTGFDDEIHALEPGSTRYLSDMSIWDIHRSEAPWLLLLNASLMKDVIRSLLTMADQGTNDVPRWPLANVYTGCMCANHANVMISDHVTKVGCDDFNITKAYNYMKSPAESARIHNGRSDLDNYNSLGYVTFDAERVSASLTMEYAVDDFMIATVARVLNLSADVTRFQKQSKNYVHLWDNKTQWMCPVFANGTKACPDEVEALAFYPIGTKYIEADAWQNLWFTPHDPLGLIALFPSVVSYVAKLEKFFEESVPWPGTTLPNPYYWAGNEPDMFAPWLFNWASRPDLTQKWTRWLLDNQYSSKPDGVPGNDDFGTLSAWQVFAMLGFYPQAGGPTYVLGSPVFQKVVIHRTEGDIVIVAHNASTTNIYVQQVQINSVPVRLPSAAFFNHSQIAKGGLLEFWMASHPSL